MVVVRLIVIMLAMTMIVFKTCCGPMAVSSARIKFATPSDDGEGTILTLSKNGEVLPVEESFEAVIAKLNGSRTRATGPIGPVPTSGSEDKT